MLRRLLRTAAALGLAAGGAALASKALRRTRGTATPHAHQVDGTDASASFAAGIADENTVPESVAGFDDTPVAAKP